MSCIDDLEKQTQNQTIKKPVLKVVKANRFSNGFLEITLILITN